MENLCGEERTHVSRRATLFFIEILYLNFFEKCRKFNFIRNYTFGKGGGGVLESRISSPYPGANHVAPSATKDERSTARAVFFNFCV